MSTRLPYSPLLSNHSGVYIVFNFYRCAIIFNYIHNAFLLHVHQLVFVEHTEEIELSPKVGNTCTPPAGAWMYPLLRGYHPINSVVHLMVLENRLVVSA